MRKKIGVFDSGLGGLTVLKQLLLYVPNADYFYLGDNARVPYGNKSKKTVIHYSEQAVEFLIDNNVDTIVIACNTASAISLDHLIEKYPEINFIGMIDSAVDEANRSSKGIVGVIGTSATIKSQAYSNSLSKSLTVITSPCPLFVPLVESGYNDFLEATKLIASKYLLEIKQSNADTLILACTHYPFLRTLIQDILPNVNIIDTGEFAARSLANENFEISKLAPTVTYFTTDEPNNFIEIAARDLNLKINSIEVVDLELYRNK